MSYHDGMSAINLEMPSRVPRTEYSVGNHWELLSVVTGIKVDNQSPMGLKIAAQREFRKIWNYDFIWNIYMVKYLVTKVQAWATQFIGAEGVDYNDKVLPIQRR